MDYQKMIKLLESEHFIKIVNHCSWFENEAILYAKEINNNIFLLFVVTKAGRIKDLRVIIACFKWIGDIGKKEPEQTLFYLSIRNDHDLRHFEKYMGFSVN